MKWIYNYCIQRCDIYAPIPSACRFWNVTKSATNRYQSISIYLSIVVENRYQLITTRNFAIDWSSIININWLIDIDWYWLISIVIDYRFHRLDTPGKYWKCRRMQRLNSSIYVQFQRWQSRGGGAGGCSPPKSPPLPAVPLRKISIADGYTF